MYSNMSSSGLPEKDIEELPSTNGHSSGVTASASMNGNLQQKGHNSLARLQASGAGRSWKIAAYVGVAILVIVGIVVGAVVGTQKKNGGSEGPDNGSDDGSDNGGADFPLDPRLHNSFWGLAYTPYGAIDCMATQANVTKDMKQLSQLTTRLRLYASECNVTSLILQAIQDLNVDVSIYAGIYIHPDLESYTNQVAQLDDAIETYGTSHILGVTVGNEYVLNAQSRGDTTPNATSWLVSRIADYKAHLQSRSITLPVGTSDAAGVFLGDIVGATDYLFANIHPWFSDNTYEEATWFSWSYLNTVVTPMVNTTWPTPEGQVPPQLFQGEFGWPSGSDSPSLGINIAGSSAGLSELQRVLDDWVCPSNQNGTQYFWFEAYDEPWKAMFGGVEQHWGLFDSSGNLKDITIPDCPHS